MDVLQLEGRAFEGKKVRFKVQGVESDQYGTWNFGELTNVNLRVARLASPTPTAITVPPPSAPDAPTWNLDQMRSLMLGLINRDRAAKGLGPVSLGTNSAAQAHAEEMLAFSYLSHWGLDGKKPYTRYTDAGGVNYEAECRRNK